MRALLLLATIALGGLAPKVFLQERDKSTPRARLKGRLSLNHLPEGATEKSEAAVLAALDWLARHQSQDGGWSCAGFDARCKLNHCGGKGDEHFDVGVTGLALACFVSAGYTSQDGAYKETVERALQYLKAAQTDDGLFGTQVAGHFQYCHASASIAMIEALGTSPPAAYKGCAEKSVRWILGSQSPGWGWRYGIADGDNDTSMTGWMMMALRSAATAGFNVDPQAAACALHWVDDVSDPLTGRTGYQTKGSLPAREKARMADFPADHSESLTAIAMLIRIWGGRRRGDDPLIAKGADLLSKQPPMWITQSYLDFYYWYFGSIAMYQIGGEPWKKWYDALKNAVLPQQRHDPKRDECGSWDPVDAWSVNGGRIYSTAMLCLALESCYRYDRILEVKK